LLDDGRIRNTGQRMPARGVRLPGHQRAVGDAGVHARGRRGAGPQPLIHGQEQRLLQRPVVVRVRRLLPAVGRPTGGAVLGATEHIHAHLGRQRAVTLSERVGHHKRAAAVPVLRRRVEVHHLRHRAAGACASQQPVGATREWVGLVTVGERKDVGGVEMPTVLRRCAGGRCEAMIEEPLATARDGRDQPIEHPAALLVGVEPLVEEHPDRPTALRPPFTDDPFSERRPIGATQRVHLGTVVFEKGHQVAHPREPGPLDHRAARLVDQLVDDTRLETAGQHHLELDQTTALVQPVVSCPEPPLVARDRHRRVCLAQTSGQGRVV